MVKANLNRSMWEQGNYTIIKVVAACLKNFSNPDLVLQKYETVDNFNKSTTHSSLLISFICKVLIQFR